MALADPQIVTINAVATNLPRTGMGPSSGTFTSADGLVELAVSHQKGKRVRRVVRLDHSKVAADPLLAGVNVKASMSAYLVIDTPTTGYSTAEAKQIVDALTSYLTSSSGARVSQVLGNES